MPANDAVSSLTYVSKVISKFLDKLELIELLDAVWL